MLIWLCRKIGKKSPTSKNSENKKQSNPKNPNKKEDKRKSKVFREEHSLQQNQSDAFMILLNTDDITGLKISTEATS